MRISDWSSDVCSSDLDRFSRARRLDTISTNPASAPTRACTIHANRKTNSTSSTASSTSVPAPRSSHQIWYVATSVSTIAARSEEHTSELQSLMRISYAVFCLQKKKTQAHKTQQAREK